MNIRIDRQLRKQIIKLLIGSVLALLLFCSLFVSNEKDTFIHNGKMFVFYRDFDGNFLSDAYQINPTNTEDNSEINLVVVVCNGKLKSAFEEALMMIKSAILYSRRHINVHIFTSQFTIQFEQEFNKWPEKFKTKMTVKFFDVVYPLQNKDEKELKDWWAPCASLRLFLPEVLKDLDSVLYVDCDVLFLAPIDELWNFFNKFSLSQVGALAPRVGWQFNVPDKNEHYIRKLDGTKTQVNSGVFLMNLTRMREERFLTDPKLNINKIAWSAELLLPLYYKYKREMFGDQDLINIIFHYNPELLYLLPCKFNYQHKFCFDKIEKRWCKSAEQDGAAVIHGTAKTFHNNYAPSFRAVYDGLKNYKWGTNMQLDLLDKIEHNLNEMNVIQHEHCGNKSKLFTAHLRQSIKHVT